MLDFYSIIINHYKNDDFREKHLKSLLCDIEIKDNNGLHIYNNIYTRYPNTLYKTLKKEPEVKTVKVRIK